MYEINGGAVRQRQVEMEPGVLENSANFFLNEASMHSVWVHLKMQNHEKRLEKLEQRFSKDSENTWVEKKKLVVSEKSQNSESIFLHHYEKLSAYIDNLRSREYLDDQFQHTTPILLEIDKIFELYSGNSNRFRRQLILKLRSALKLNCLEQLFTEEQITILLTIVERLRAPMVEKQDVLDSLDELIDCGLSPFPSLEEDERENEAFSGHDDSD